MSSEWLGLSRDSLLAIAAVAAVTYMFRGGGYWLMGRLTLSPRIESGLAYLPGAVITSLVVPSMLEAGFAGVIGVIVVAITIRIRSNLLLALATGVFAVWLVRHLM